MSRLNPEEIRRSDSPRNADQLRAMRRPENDRSASTAAMQARHEHSLTMNAAMHALEEKIVDRVCAELFTRLGVRES